MVSISSSNLDGESPILSRPAIADWCNGSTLDSDSRNFGPIPKSAAYVPLPPGDDMVATHVRCVQLTHGTLYSHVAQWLSTRLLTEGL